MRAPRSAHLGFFVVALVTLAACLGPLPEPERAGEDVHTHALTGLPVTIEYLGSDAAYVPLIEKGIRDGLHQARIWGPLDAPLRIVVYPDNDALTAALDKPGAAWLRAWARADEIALQSPGSWAGHNHWNFLQLMAHEMTHVVHFQVAKISGLRSRKDDPLWFREGLASWTAGQGPQRYDRRMLRMLLRSSNLDLDLVDPSDRSLNQNAGILYSLGHRMVETLLRAEQVEGARELLARLRAGESFDAAFVTIYGEPHAAWRSRWMAELLSDASTKADAR